MSIDGTWYNELGSKMEITSDGATISGTYQTAVGYAQNTYALIGWINTEPSQGGQATGWTVMWTNDSGSSNSVTTWSGQLQEVQGQEEIVTFWLLTSEQLPQNDWAATNIGQDTFTRTAPSSEQIAIARKRRGFSHPTAKTSK